MEVFIWTFTLAPPKLNTRNNTTIDACGIMHSYMFDYYDFSTNWIMSSKQHLAQQKQYNKYIKSFILHGKQNVHNEIIERNKFDRCMTWIHKKDFFFMKQTRNR